MLRFAFALLCAALLFAAPASAADFGQAPPLTVKGVRPECGGPAGAPGELFSMGRHGVQFHELTRAGATPGPALRMGQELPDCAAVATTAGGAGVVACCANEFVVVAALRDPGGSWGDPAELSPGEGWRPEKVAAAVSDRGDAIVTWTETSFDRRTMRVSVARRPAGGTWAPPQVIQASVPVEIQSVATAIAADGEAVVLWRTPTPGSPNIAGVMVATAPATGRFGAPTRLATLPSRSEASLAASPDGRALVAFSDGKSLLVAERGPGGSFAAPARVGAAVDPVAVRTTAVLGADGRAAIAWTGIGLGGVSVVTRAPGGTFSAPSVLARGDRRMTGDVFLNGVFGEIDPTPGRWGFGGADVHALLDGSGRAFVAFDRPHLRDGVEQRTANLALVPLDGGTPVTHSFGGDLGYVFGVAPVVLPDGAPALTWFDSEGRNDYRMRLAAEGAGSPEAEIPQVKVGPPTDRRIPERGNLHLPVECSGPCELRAQMTGAVSGDESLQLDTAGKGTLSIYPAVGDGGTVVRVRVSYGAREGTRVKVRMLRFKVVVPKTHDRPTKVFGLRAVRHGNAIRVTWKTDRDLDPEVQAFWVTGARTTSRFEDPSVSTPSGGAPRGHEFTTELKPAEGVRWVTLYSPAAQPFKQVVRVR
ncbi:MAG TPA: hypothetical protein VI300_08505 [Solirubrobacter sp.]